MQGYIGCKNLVCLLGLSFLIILLLKGGSLADESKSARLQQKIKEISALRAELSARQTQALLLSEQLKDRMSSLEEEIRSKTERSRPTTLQEAVLDPRIDHNIKLIQRLLRYLGGLDRRIRLIKYGDHELEFFLLQADDDLKMVQTLHDMKIEELVIRMDQVGRKYRPITQGLLVDISDIVLTPPEKIRGRILEGPEPVQGQCH